MLNALRDKIGTIDWRGARSDVQRFLPTKEQEGLQVWSETFFLHQVARMEGYLADCRPNPGNLSWGDVHAEGRRDSANVQTLPPRLATIICCGP